MTDVRISGDELITDAVGVLTRAARYSADSSDALDVAGFLAHALAATAANVGGEERLLATRPGSWEASHLHALLHGRLGNEPDSWQKGRTGPLLVPLNVAELIERPEPHPGILGLDEAIDAIGLRYTTADDDEALDAWDAEIDAAIRRYEAEYPTSGDTFETAVRILGTMINRNGDIRFSADVNPMSCWRSDTAVTNPTAYDTDAATVTVWRAAHDSVPLANADAWLSPTTEHPTAREE